VLRPSLLSLPRFRVLAVVRFARNMNGLFETSTTSVEDLKKRFSAYEDDIRNNYLFVQVLLLVHERSGGARGPLEGVCNGC
jgi:hypothetical protein